MTDQRANKQVKPEKKPEKADSIDEQVTSSDTLYPNNSYILRLQSTIGNNAVQRLLNVAPAESNQRDAMSSSLTSLVASQNRIQRGNDGKKKGRKTADDPMKYAGRQSMTPDYVKSLGSEGLNALKFYIEEDLRRVKPTEAIYETLRENWQLINAEIQSRYAETKADFAAADEPFTSGEDSTAQDFTPQFIQSLSYEELTALKEELETQGAGKLSSDFTDASRENNLSLINKEIEHKVNAAFNNFPQVVQINNSFPKAIQERIEFLEVMALYLGSYENVIRHYMSIRKANVPGAVYLQENAAAALEQVAADLGGKMPSSGTGLGLRGRFKANTREPMGHPAGYAIDYRAEDNPRLGRNEAATLLELDTGRDPNFNLRGRGARRKLIGEMETGTANKDEQDKFFADFDTEYEAVSKASDSFGDKINKTENLSKLKTLQEWYHESRREQAAKQKRLKEIAKLQKRKKKDAAEQEALAAESDHLTEDIAKLESYQKEVILTQTIDFIQPWLDMIQDKKTKLEKDHPESFKDTPAEEAQPAKGKKKKEVKKKDPIRDEWNTYDALEKKLKTDLHFMYGSSKNKEVSTPSVMQLLEHGFFNPDAEPEAGDNFNPAHHGFNAAFMKSMMKNGFEQGVCWDGASQDSMHFEYVRGYDTMGSQKKLKPRLDALKERFHGKKAQEKKQEAPVQKSAPKQSKMPVS